VYILQSLKDFGFYIGVTNNINRRFIEHNQGKSKSTQYRRPFNLVRIEEFDNIKLAYQRERFLKNKKNSKIIRNIIKSPDVHLKSEIGIPISPLANIGTLR